MFLCAAGEPDPGPGPRRGVCAAQHWQPGHTQGPQLHGMPGVLGGPPQGEARHGRRPLQLRRALLLLSQPSLGDSVLA